MLDTTALAAESVCFEEPKRLVPKSGQSKSKSTFKVARALAQPLAKPTRVVLLLLVVAPP